MKPSALTLGSHMLELSGDSEEFSDRTAYDIYAPHLERLVDEYFKFRDALDDSMIAAGLGDLSIDNLWPHLEFTYLCERLRHGVAFTDIFYRNTADYVIAELARKIVKNQPHLEDGAYTGDDGTVYFYNYHGTDPSPCQAEA
jgi:hypothetical protein